MTMTRQAPSEEPLDPDESAFGEKEFFADDRDSSGEQTAPSEFTLDKATAMAWLHRDRRPRVIVDRALKLLWANAAARRDLREGSPVFIEHGQLRFADALGDRDWSAFLAALAEDEARTALTTPDGHRCVVLSALSSDAAGSETILLKITPGRPLLDFVESGLAEQYGLTKAEWQVGELLAAPNTPAQIAHELGLSIHTVRTHVRRIYAKLAVRTHPQFLRLVHTYCST